MNNRKNTAGRAEIKTTQDELIGFTICSQKINEDGKKTNNHFSRYVPIEWPKVSKMKFKKHYSKRKQIKQAHAVAYHKAYNTALEVVENHGTPCHIIKVRRRLTVVIANA